MDLSHFHLDCRIYLTYPSSDTSTVKDVWPLLFTWQKWVASLLILSKTFRESTRFYSIWNWPTLASNPAFVSFCFLLPFRLLLCGLHNLRVCIRFRYKWFSVSVHSQCTFQIQYTITYIHHTKMLEIIFNTCIRFGYRRVCLSVHIRYTQCTC